MDARQQALSILNDIDKNQAYANLKIEELFRREKADPKDRRLVTRLVYGTLQNRILLDAVLKRYITRGYNRLKLPVRNALRLALYQLLFLNRTADYAVIDQAVRQVKKQDFRSAGLVNAVLRKIAGEREDILAFIDQLDTPTRVSIDPWIYALYQKSYPGKADAVLAKINEVAPLTLRINTLKTSVEEAVKALNEQGIDTALSPISSVSLTIDTKNLPEGGLEELSLIQNGEAIVQDSGAALIGLMLDPKPGETAADLCAAPGGKTTHLSAMMDNDGVVYAGDIYPSRLKLIEDNAERLGCSNIKTMEMDASKALPIGMVDKLLLDVPCSGLGILRRKPDIRYRITPEDLVSLEEIQKAILDNASEHLKDGGEMVYSTCTINPDENEEQVARFLRTHPDFSLIDEKKTSFLDGADCFYMAKLKKADHSNEQ